MPGTAVPFWRPRRLGHANLFVSDLDRSMAFYRDVIGLEEVYRRPPIKAGFLSNGNTHHDIGMVEVTSPLCRTGAAGLNHLAFELEHEADLVEGYRRAVAAGVEFPRTIDHDITRSIYGFDPDGNAVEIYADMIRDWRRARSGIITKPTPRWTPGDPPPSPERRYHEAPEIRRATDAVFHPTRITHAVLVADDYERMLGYYRDRIGLALLEGNAESAFAVLGGTCGAYGLCLFGGLDGVPTGLHHVGFPAWDEADLVASVSRLLDSGGAIEREIDHPARRCVHVIDPDGLRLQIYVDRESLLTAIDEVDAETALFLA